MPKLSNYIFPVIAIAASITGFTIASRMIERRDHPPIPPPMPENFEAFDMPLELANFLRLFITLARDGQQSRGVLLLSGMSEQKAMKVAAQTPDVDVKWAPVWVMMEAMKMPGWEWNSPTPSSLLPWVLFYGIPAVGPGVGTGEGEALLGGLEPHLAALGRMIEYARGDMAEGFEA